MLSSRVNRRLLSRSCVKEEIGLSDAAGWQARWCPECPWHDPAHWMTLGNQLTPPARLAPLPHMLFFHWCRYGWEMTLVTHMSYKWEQVASFNRVEWNAYLWWEQQGLSVATIPSLDWTFVLNRSRKFLKLMLQRFRFFSISSSENSKMLFKKNKQKLPEGRVSGNDFQPWVNH